MSELLLTYEPIIRLAAFLGVFSALVLWELRAPRRPQTHGRWRRWPANIGIVALNTLLARLVFPIPLAGVALLAETRGWGMLPALPLPYGLKIVIAVLLLDLAIYLQHVMFHAVPVFWRLHRMHHADLEFDVTTGSRFHPFEILLSMVIKLGVVAALGAPAAAVLIFEVLLNATSMFNHGNAGLAPPFERVLRWFVVTPDMHRVHHSVLPHEANSNFGFNLPWWDRLCGTYRAQPQAGHETMTIGIEQFRDPRELRLGRMLLQPFREDARLYPLGSLQKPQWIEVDALASRLEQASRPAVIDVRGADEFTGPLGHIKDASNIPVGGLAERLSEINALKDKPVILVCRTDKRSAKAAALLRDAGFSDVLVLRGGMEQWNQKGLPVEGRTPSTQS